MKYIIGAVISGALIYGFLFTFDKIKGNTDWLYVDRPCPVCEPKEQRLPIKCEECKPTIKIEGGKIYPNCKLQEDLIDIRDAQIENLKASNEDLQTELKCFKDKYISWESYKCN